MKLGQKLWLVNVSIPPKFLDRTCSLDNPPAFGLSSHSDNCPFLCFFPHVSIRPNQNSLHFQKTAVKKKAQNLLSQYVFL